MRDIARSAAVVGIGLVCALVLSFPSAAAGRTGTVAPSDTTPETTEPAPPETTLPAPDDSTPADTLVGAGTPDGDIDTTVAVIAIIGFITLLGVASWWMVRRSNPDAEPMPPRSSPPPSDLI